MNSETPNTSFEKVETWVDIVAMEHEVLDFWKSERIFERLREKNQHGSPFSFLDGPITANNPMGVHHAWGRSLKDAFQRYHAMNGRKLRYQNGFDCQGLWVEVEVEKEHGFASKREIADFGIDRFVEACKARVKKYSGIQTEQSIRLGMWMDWEHSYFTMSEENNYTIWSFLKKCHERGKIYRGADVMPWSGRAGTAYSQMEIIEGRKLVAHTSLFIKMPLIEREGENLLVWTTTPWTLTSNVAAAVNAELDYVKLRSHRDQELYYFAAENLEFKRLDKQYKEKRWVDGVPRLKTIAQLFNERGGYTIEGTVKGAELLGLHYRGPFDELEGAQSVGGYPFVNSALEHSAASAHVVIDGGRDSIGNPVVVAGEGTGIVHIAPGCGDIDHAIGVERGLPMVAPLDESAAFMPAFGPLTGMHATAKSTVEWIVENLRQKGLLVATEQYPHVYPHCWRSGDELVFRMVDEWYINMDWRDEIIKIVDDIRWIPEYGREREIEWLSNMRDWMISKKRFWGLALPIWVCESCEHFDVIGSREELKARAIAGWELFDGHSPHRPWIDHVKLACSKCGGTAHRVEDVGNPWLDAGIVPYSTVRYNTDRDYWKEWIPADLVLECFPGQFRNWFYSLLALSTMMEGIAPFKTLLGHALVRDEQGREMHKSWGNAIWFDDAAEQAGADVMRWLYMRQNPQFNLNFGFGPLREVRGGFFNTVWNSYAFFANYARLAGWTPSSSTSSVDTRPAFDRWILSELQRTIQEVRTGFEDFDVRRSANAIEAFVEDLSNWYVRHNRRRFWSIEDAELQGSAAFETLYHCLDALIRMCAPMIPFLTEKIYSNLVLQVSPDAPASIHLCDFPQGEPALIDEELSREMRAIMQLTKLALSTREAHKLKVRQPLQSLTIGPATEVEARAARRFEHMLRDDLNVKNIIIEPVATPSPLNYELKVNFKTLGPRFGKLMKAIAQAAKEAAPRLIQELRAGVQQLSLRVEAEELTLEREDILLEAQATPNQAVAEEQGSWVALDTVITEELALEGCMRELLRRVQVLRKESGLEIEDRIHLRWCSDDAQLIRAIEQHHAFMADELLATLERVDALENPQLIEIEEGKLQLILVKKA
ncbi:MAG: isoleucine--tRNA ligase [Myxococcota bacterium]|jgi:isoleucyl-tRNA synthetase|nr:isoleucine--tRNA ligase [Myxococcota bacterium]